MNYIKAYYIYKKYIEELMRTQMLNSSPVIQDIFNKKDYDKILNGVLEVIRENPHANLTTLRLILFQKSGLKEIMDKFVNETKITPGVVLDFGTFKTRDTVICGKCQEYTMQNGILVPDEKEIEQDTIFDLASTSKLFTAVSILKLAEEQRIDVFDPITKYVPEFKNLQNVSIYDLLKFRVAVVTDKRVDSAKTKEEAEQILFGIHLAENQFIKNAYTDMGAMVSYLNVPKEKLYRVANENYSITIDANGNPNIRYDNPPGTQHDAKARAIGALEGIAPGHAGYFSTTKDMIKLGNALINGDVISKDSVLSMSDTASGFKEDDTYFYGSLVYLKQPNPKHLGVRPSLSGKSFMSPGFAGTTLCVDPINKFSLFIGSNRLHNRIYQIHTNQKDKIKVDEQNKKTFTLPNGEEKIVCADYTRDKEIMVSLALQLTLQYQLLEKIFGYEKEMHLVREL